MPKIIHFDSEKQLTDVFKTKFKKAGFEYINYSYLPKDFVDKVAEEKPDLIIVAMVIKNIDGFEVAKVLKADQRTKDVQILGLVDFAQEVNVVAIAKDMIRKKILHPKGAPYTVVGGERRDLQEFDPKLKDKFEAAGEEARIKLKNIGSHMGVCHVHWSTKKKILKKKYNIDWKTPAEMNPYILYD